MLQISNLVRSIDDGLPFPQKMLRQGLPALCTQKAEIAHHSRGIIFSMKNKAFQMGRVNSFYLIAAT